MICYEILGWLISADLCEAPSINTRAEVVRNLSCLMLRYISRPWRVGHRDDVFIIKTCTEWGNTCGGWKEHIVEMLTRVVSLCCAVCSAAFGSLCTVMPPNVYGNVMANGGKNHCADCTALKSSSTYLYFYWLCWCTLVFHLKPNLHKES